MDLVLLSRYIADGCTTDPDGYNVSLNPNAGDVNNDGRLNALDLVLISRYVADGCKTDPEGYNVELKPSSYNFGHTHTMQETPYKSPTCTEEGNIAYWYCTGCEKYFSNEAGTTEVTREMTVIEAAGHEEEIIPATSTTTEGKRCSKCGEVLVEPQPIQEDEYEIRYDIANGISYINELVLSGAIVNPNPATNKTSTTLILEDVSVDGYRFLGWFYEREGGTAVEFIPAGQTGVIKLFAHWAREENHIVYNYDPRLASLIDTSVLEDVTYSVDKTKQLPVLSLPGYTFVGWSDENGNICTQIKPGSTGEKQFYANWVSDRNKAWEAKELGDPYVYSDDEVILFAYEIGQIENVPICEIENFGKINAGGVMETVTKEVSVETSEECLKAYTSSVEKATTKNASWTLDSGWTDSISINSEYATAEKKDVETIETESRNESGAWYLNKTSGGEHSDVTVDSTDKYDLKTTTKNKKTYGSTDETTYDSKTNLHGYDVNGSLELGAKESLKTSGVLKALGADGGLELTQKLTVGGGYENKTTDKSGKDTVKKTGSDSDEGDGSQTGTIKNHTTNTTDVWNWSEDAGQSGSQENGWIRTASQTLSEEINKKEGYGSSYIKSENTSQTNGVVSADAVKDGFSSQTTYSKVQYEKKTVSYTTGAAITGWHRWVMAATAHVFGVVGYDIAKNSYFVYTYSILDDDFTKFADYSYCSSSYSDNQISVINFQAPDDIVDYVKAKVFQTDGLEFDKDGNVTKYTGSDSVVVIPEYARISNMDGTYHVVKVTELKPDVFKNNSNITAVVLSDFITAIPANEFEGCSNLREFYASGVTSIGENAFSECPFLSSITLSEEITELGTSAYTSTQFLEVTASNYDVIEGVIQSGAKEIVIDLSRFDGTLDNKTLVIPDGTESFVLRAFDKTFENLTIISNAKNTKLNRINIISTGTTPPLQINSELISLCQVNVNSAGVAIAMLSDATELNLYGSVNVTSTIENAVLTGNLTIKKLEGNLDTALNVAGNVLTYGKVTDEGGYLKFISGELKDSEKDSSIKKETLQKMLVPHTLSFDANGGSIVGDETHKTVYYGTAIGTLPVPERANYTFSGWYTQRDGGSPVLPGDAFLAVEDVTIYAHWSISTYVLRFDANGGQCTESQRNATINAAIGVLPTPTREHYNFDGWYTAATGGTRITADDIFNATSNITLYAHWNPKTFTVTLNANGGSCSTASKTGTYGVAIGAIPNPVRDYYTFDGWYTSASGGDRVTESTVFSTSTDVTIYAHWTQNAVSGWVLKSSMPANAQIVNQKWTYNQRTNTESRETSLSGYTQYGSYWVQSSAGSSNYATFPTGYDTSNGYYTSFMKSPYSAYENTTSKREVSNAWAGYVYWHWMYDCGSSSAGNRTIYDHKGTASYNNFYYKYFGAFTSSSSYTATSSSANYDCGSYGYKTYYNTGRTSYAQSQGTHYWYRFDYYTSSYKDYYKMFKYYKVEAKESATAVTPTDLISDVQNWVQYRPI